jgi:hypothetical protein
MPISRFTIPAVTEPFATSPQAAVSDSGKMRFKHHITASIITRLAMKMNHPEKS